MALAASRRCGAVLARTVPSGMLRGQRVVREEHCGRLRAFSA